jgi:hypothetical protein
MVASKYSYRARDFDRDRQFAERVLTLALQDDIDALHALLTAWLNERAPPSRGRPPAPLPPVEQLQAEYENEPVKKRLPTHGVNPRTLRRRRGHK